MKPAHRSAISLVAMLALAAVVATGGCSSDDGRELPAPDPDTTTSSAPPSFDSTPAT